MTPQEVDNPFGSNINEILRQSFFLEHGFMGEFSKYYVMSLCHYLCPEAEEYKRMPSLYKGIEWSEERAYDFIQQVGEPLLRSQLIIAYKNSRVFSKRQRIEALRKELAELEHEENRSN